MMPEPRGLYTNKNSIFVASKDYEIEDVFAVMMHESSHFIMNQLFNNDSKPFPKGGGENSLEYKFAPIVLQTKEKIDEIALDYAGQEVDDDQSYEFDPDYEAFQVINNVFSSYPEDEWAMELIVRVPEIIALVGAEKGNQWLQDKVPELLNFYQEEINPRITEYLQNKNAANYLKDLGLPPMNDASSQPK